MVASDSDDAFDSARGEDERVDDSDGVGFNRVYLHGSIQQH